MQRLLLSLTAAGMLLLAQSAFADTIVGTIESFEAEGTVLVLEDGTTFNVPEDIDLSGLEVGTKVEIEFDVVDDQNQLKEVFLAD